MTVAELIQLVGRRPGAVITYFALMPVLAWLLGQLHGVGAGARRPLRYAYSVLVYLCTVPGIFALLLLAYSLGVARADLLRLDLLIYILPIVAMGVTLAVIRRRVALRRLPGFERVSGLALLLGVVFVASLVLTRTHIGIFFGAGLTTFGVLLGGALLLLWLAVKLLLGGR